MMNSYTCFLAFFFILLVSVSCNNIIQEACNKAVKSDSQPKVTFNFCVGSLQKHPKGETARSFDDLAPITLHIMKSAAKHVSFIISKMMKTKNVGIHTRAGLEVCAQLYSLADSDVQRINGYLKAKDYFSAKTGASGLVSATCEDVFNEGKKTVSPIAKENNDFCRLAIMLLTFIPDAKSE
ncbi:hypothetical protein Godav_016561 [Gossypium davidsonii]|uniref:Pectinesterase inhibitor domain-containing protein n=2 Tax=Gossypium TaxID=3633 RepID=A0A7J8RRS3_GOSDV|nr:hypothetical protein [Gossypium davidsonii]MBA0651796.1 hypothetical protein [Gossypium klotzschianum]